MRKFFVILTAISLINSANAFAMLTSSTYSSMMESKQPFAIDNLAKAEPREVNENTLQQKIFWNYFKCADGISPSTPDKIAQVCMEAANAGDDRASLLVALLYSLGRGLPKDKGEALDWLKRASDLHNPVAQLDLALFELVDPKPDFLKTFRLVQKAYDGGIVEAGYLLAIFHLDGKGTEKDYALAKNYLQELKQNSPEVQYVLGIMAMKGHGEPVDTDLAIRYLTSASESGYLPAMDSLAFIYLDDKKHQNNMLARKWLEHCVESKRPNCQYNLGYMYEAGLGYDKNYADALHYYLLAAENDHLVAQYKVGLAYKDGEGVLPDPKIAFHWTKLAAL